MTAHRQTRDRPNIVRLAVWQTRLAKKSTAVSVCDDDQLVHTVESHLFVETVKNCCTCYHTNLVHACERRDTVLSRANVYQNRRECSGAQKSFTASFEFTDSKFTGVNVYLTWILRFGRGLELASGRRFKTSNDRQCTTPASYLCHEWIWNTCTTESTCYILPTCIVYHFDVSC